MATLNFPWVTPPLTLSVMCLFMSNVGALITHSQIKRLRKCVYFWRYPPQIDSIFTLQEVLWSNPLELTWNGPIISTHVKMPTQNLRADVIKYNDISLTQHENECSLDNTICASNCQEKPKTENQKIKLFFKGGIEHFF